MFGLKKKVQLKLRYPYRSEVLQALARARAQFAIERRARNANILAKLVSFPAHVQVFVAQNAATHSNIVSRNHENTTPSSSSSLSCELVPCHLQVGVDALYQIDGTCDVMPFVEFTKIQSLDIAADDPTCFGLTTCDYTTIFHTAAPNDVVREILGAALALDVDVSVTRTKTALEIQSQHVHFAASSSNILAQYHIELHMVDNNAEPVCRPRPLVESPTDTYIYISSRHHYSSRCTQAYTCMILFRCCILFMSLSRRRNCTIDASSSRSI
jgi:hypothetical protein